MSNPRKNGEGYDDLTAYAALQKIQREVRRKQPYRPLVFICSPLAGAIHRNQQRARDYCRFAIRKGAIPIAPHIYFTQFLDERKKEQRQLGIYCGIVLLSKCSEIWVFGSFWSRGMRMEIARADAKGILVRFFTEDCKEVFRTEKKEDF